MTGSPSGNPRPPLRTLAFVLATVVVALASLEGLARLIPYREWISGTALKSPTIDLNLAASLAVEGKGRVLYNKPDPVLLWRNDPDSGLYEWVNSLGFRGEEFAREKSGGVIRVAMLGDSVTFGWGHDDTATTFPALIEERLDESGIRAQVYNFGAPGYSSYQGLRLMQTEVLSFAPDVVTAQFGWNDHWEAYRYTDKDQARIALVLANRGGFLRHSALAGLIRVGSAYARYAFHTSAILPEPSRRQAPVTAGRDDVRLRVSPDDYRHNLQAIVAAARKAGARAALGTAPHVPGTEVCMFRVCFEPEIHERYNDIVREVAAESRIPLADLDRAFADEGDDASALFLSHGIHFSPGGHELAARVWTRAIRRAVEGHPPAN